MTGVLGVALMAVVAVAGWVAIMILLLGLFVNGDDVEADEMGVMVDPWERARSEYAGDDRCRFCGDCEARCPDDVC